MTTTDNKKASLQIDKDGAIIGIGTRAIRPQGTCEECIYFDPSYNKARNRCYYPNGCGVCKCKERRALSSKKVDGGYMCKSDEEACIRFKTKAERAKATPLSDNEAATLLSLLGKLASAYTATQATGRRF